MAAVLCPKHGRQIALLFCEHALGAVVGMQSVHIYLQRSQYGWHSLCDLCVRNVPESLGDADHLACTKCVMEWVVATGSDYHQRSQKPVNEYPQDGPD